MKLYLLTRAEGEYADFDEAAGFVVAARSAAAARRLIARSGVTTPKQFGDEGGTIWLYPSRTSCRELKAGDTPRVIIRDYNRG